ncbi:hypothetical protein ACSL103130_04150 [Actinomyces slackii]
MDLNHVPLPRAQGLQEGHAQDALGVTDGANRRLGGHIDPGPAQAGQGGVLGHEDAGH